MTPHALHQEHVPALKFYSYRSNKQKKSALDLHVLTWSYTNYVLLIKTCCINKKKMAASDLHVLTWS